MEFFYCYARFYLLRLYNTRFMRLAPSMPVNAFRQCKSPFFLVFLTFFHSTPSAGRNEKQATARATTNAFTNALL